MCPKTVPWTAKITFLWMQLHPTNQKLVPSCSKVFPTIIMSLMSRQLSHNNPLALCPLVFEMLLEYYVTHKA